MDEENRTEKLIQILQALQSDENWVVFLALEQLNGMEEINEAVLRKLEVLSGEYQNPEIRSRARAVLSKFVKPNAEVPPAETKPDQPSEVLQKILAELQSPNSERQLRAIAFMHTVNYSSAAVRFQLEKLAVLDPNLNVRAQALAALDLPTHRNIRQMLNKTDRGSRNVLLREIEDWQKAGLLQKENAEVLRRRYNFDVMPQPALPPEPAPAPPTIPQPVLQPTPPPQHADRPVLPTPSVMTGPQPTLLQTLLSETSIKIALYLGAFFVIASAVILGVLSEGARLPVLIISTLIFGGLSMAIYKRLPQPSFILFIVFSFLLPITADVIENLLNLSTSTSAEYWFFVSMIMAMIWMSGTFIYESRLFSISAFLALLLGLLRVGKILDTPAEFHLIMAGLASLAGLAGTQALKKWRDADFALPVFITAQVVQGITLSISFSIFFFHLLFDASVPAAWHFASALTWALACLFFVLSNFLFPFAAFSWLVASVLLPIPWFIGAALQLDTAQNAFIFFIWTVLLAAGSEITHWVEKTRSYSVPLLMTSLLCAVITATSGFIGGIPAGMLSTLGIACAYSVLQMIRPRGWMWTFALLNFIVAYFALLALPEIKKLNLFFSYELLLPALIFLFPDFLLKNDFKDLADWRHPPRIFGAVFTLANFMVLPLLGEKPLIHTAVVFFIHTLFFTAYALRYKESLIGYVAATTLAISLIVTLNHLTLDLWVPALSFLSLCYFLGGFVLRKKIELSAWRSMLETSALVLGSLVSFAAFGFMKPFSGWFIMAIAVFFVVEMYSRRESLFEAGAHIFLGIAALMILRDFKVEEISFILLALSLVMFSLDLILTQTYRSIRTLEWVIKGLAALLTFTCSLFLLTGSSLHSSVGFSILTIFFAFHALVRQKTSYGYAAAAYLPLALIFILRELGIDAWLPVLSGISTSYFIFGLLMRARQEWSILLRNSALALGTIIAFSALIILKETGGWYALLIGILFAVEMYISRDGWLEIGVPVLFNIGAYLILHDFQADKISWYLLAFSLVWLLSDLCTYLTFADPRVMKWPIRMIGGILTVCTYVYLFMGQEASDAAIGFGIYTLLFLVISLVYLQPDLLYTFTLTLPLLATFLFRTFGFTQWIHPVVCVAAAYYVTGFIMRHLKVAKDWDANLLISGLGLATFVSMAAPILGGLDAAVPVAVAATLWAIEAFAKRSVWLALPGNILYLLSYFIILVELRQSEPQFFTVGAALLGLFQHYLLVRAGSKTGAFITGMISQLVLLGTSYIQMLDTQKLGYFVVLFLQFLAVLFYGGFIVRSRSLTFTPIAIIVLASVTVLYSQFKGLGTVTLFGCTGIIMLIFGIIAVVQRERITTWTERLNSWEA